MGEKMGVSFFCELDSSLTRWLSLGGFISVGQGPKWHHLDIVTHWRCQVMDKKKGEMILLWDFQGCILPNWIRLSFIYSPRWQTFDPFFFHIILKVIRSADYKFRKRGNVLSDFVCIIPLKVGMERKGTCRHVMTYWSSLCKNKIK